MEVEADPTTTVERPARNPEAEVVAFLEGRSVPCPRCDYDLRDIKAARCPECGEPLVVRIGSARASFGWLLLAAAPGCFSGVAAVFLSMPIVFGYVALPKGQRAPWPVLLADMFGFFSAASVVLMYRHRHRIMYWTTRRQAAFAAGIWGIHILAFALFVFTIWWIQR